MEQFAASNFVPDPGAYMKSWTCAEMSQKANNWTARNVERWCNPAYDALDAQAAREMDPERRRQLFIQMNDMLVDEVVAIPIGVRARSLAPARTGGYRPDAVGCGNVEHRGLERASP